ncbi:reverse transcriptase domain-containing protein [Tanacetum coccineum]
MIYKPMTQLLMKDVKFDFSDDCKKAFNILKEKLTTAPIIISPDWNVPFELMCDASDFAVGAVLGQQINGKFKPIYYASKTLNNAQEHYTTTEKELLAIVFSFDKFCPYLILSKTVVYTDHSALKYFFSKQDAKPRLIRIAYKTPTGCTHFRLVYRKACHLPVEIEHKAYWVLKQCNMDLTAAAKNCFMELNELMELRDGAFKMHPCKLKSRWYGPNVAKTVYPYGTIEIIDRNGINFKVNGQRLKKYHDGHTDVEDKEVVEFEQDTM